MATADDEPGRRSNQPGRRRPPRWLVPLAFAATLAIALVVGLVVTRDEASAPGPATMPAPIEVEAASIYDFTSLAEMVAASDVIVVGTVVATEPGRLVGDPASGGVISRLVTIDVDEVIGGDANGGDANGGDANGSEATIVIEEEATLPDGTPLIVNGVSPSAVGDHGIWFLDRIEDAELPVFLVINSQGRFLTPAQDPTGDLIGGDQRNALVRSLQDQPLTGLVTATRQAIGTD